MVGHIEILGNYSVMCIQASKNTGIDAPRLHMLFPTQYDVGVDNNNFTPVSFEQVKWIIERQVEQSKK